MKDIGYWNGKCNRQYWHPASSSRHNEEAASEVVKKENNFGCWHWLFYSSSIVVYFYDFATDIILAIEYAQRAQYWYCGLTVSFVVFPAYLVASMSVWEPDDDQPRTFPSTETPAGKTPFWLKFLKGSFVVLLLSPVGR